MSKTSLGTDSTATKAVLTLFPGTEKKTFMVFEAGPSTSGKEGVTAMVEIVEIKTSEQQRGFVISRKQSDW